MEKTLESIKGLLPVIAAIVAIAGFRNVLQGFGLGGGGSRGLLNGVPRI